MFLRKEHVGFCSMIFSANANLTPRLLITLYMHCRSRRQLIRENWSHFAVDSTKPEQSELHDRKRTIIVPG